MAIKFKETAGEAKKGNVEFYKYVPGVNKFRMVGDVLARYVYWLKTSDNKPVSMECVGFNREEERFDNVEKDWVREYFPEENCSWSYMIQGIDAKEPDKIKAIPLKKKMFGQIIDAAKKLGIDDPTDIDKGFWVTVDRKKTGPLVFNIEYIIDILACQSDVGALDDKTKEMLEKNLKPIDSLFKRPTSDEQHAFLKDRILPKVEAEEVPDEFSPEEPIKADDFDDDIPF